MKIRPPEDLTTLPQGDLRLLESDLAPRLGSTRFPGGASAEQFQRRGRS